ncbi:MAG: ATP-binding cassette domain-containing protein, partial [Thermomicrobiales bacterium]
TVLLGPNGAGKSTLLATLAGDIRPDRGDVIMLGVSIRSFSKRVLVRHRAVYTSTGETQIGFPVRTVVEFGRRGVDSARRDDDDRVVRESMEVTEVSQFSNRALASLSEGERSRVGLARVLAQETPILLLDEPTASLDVRHQHLVMRHLRELAHQGRCVIAAVHDINLACAYADRIGLLSRGTLVALDSPERVLSSALLQDVFNWPMSVMTHPSRSGPVVFPDIDDVKDVTS